MQLKGLAYATAVCTTLNSAAARSMERTVGCRVAVIDEAAQATEPSTLIPLQLGLARLKQVDGSGAAADADLATSQLRGSASLPPC
eukprot:COSAG01_NODE_2325_length_7907_cov_4.765881_4_plen_86_part_00